MTFARLLFFLPIVCSSMVLDVQEPIRSISPENTIRIDVSRVDVGVTVTGPGGRFVEGLKAKDFKIYDNGVEVPVADFSAVDESADVVILMECGPAAIFTRKTQIQAAKVLLDTLSPKDRVAVVCYSDQPLLFLDFTLDKKHAMRVVEGLNLMAGFGQLNLFASVAKTIDWLAAMPGKKNIILLSTGMDTTPNENLALIQQKLSGSDIRVLAVSTLNILRVSKRMEKNSTLDRFDREFLQQGYTLIAL